jgi:hypothetical protein
MGALDANPFGTEGGDYSEGEQTPTIQIDPKFDGSSGENQKYDLTSSHNTVSAAQIANVGRS